MDTTNEKRSLIEQFIEQTSVFGLLSSESLQLYFEQESEPESELVKIYLDSYKKIFVNIGSELKKSFSETDNETQSTVEKYLANSDVNTLLKSTNGILSKKKKIIGIIEKILPILEIIKKAIYHITELFPNFLSKFLKKILTPLLELLDNIGKRILDLFGIGNKNASFYLKSAEEDFLNSHPKWRKLQFESF